MTQFLRRSILAVAAILIAGCAERQPERDGLSASASCPELSDAKIDWPMKIGIGAWVKGPPGWTADRIEELGVAWYYLWEPRPLIAGARDLQAEFVPMIWNDTHLRDDPMALADVVASPATTLLGFNEPNQAGQADMTVEEAVALWPRLSATRLRLGSPAASQNEVLWPESWLQRFMDAAAAADLRVDFIAVHYYAVTPDVARFRRFLEIVHDLYKRPIWVTEWGLVHPDTWKDRRARYDLEETACFFRAGAAMLDDLGFVERHAWFAAFGENGNWRLNTHAIADDGSLTPVGRAIVEVTGGGAE